MDPLSLIVDGGICVPTNGKAQERLRAALSIPNPDYHRRLAQDLYVGDTEPRLYATREESVGLRMPRGATKKIGEVLRKAKIDFRWDDRRVEGVPIEVGGLNVTPRDYQAEAIESLQRYKQGLVVIGCGGGKTTIGLGCIAALKVRTLVLVHTDDLLKQWQDELRAKLDVESTKIGGGKVVLGNVTVAMIQTMQNAMHRADVIEWLGGCGLCILDEAHHAPAESFMKVLEHVPAKYRLGLTATPKRGDGRGKFVDWAFGERFVELSTKDLLDMGYLMLPELEVLATDFVASKKALSHRDPRQASTAIQGELAEYEPRMHMIASIAAAEAQAGEVVLLLANRENYCRRLGKMCWDRGAKPVVVTGKTAKKLRADTLTAFRAGKIKFLIATSLANEGLDAPHLSRIIFAWPDSSRSATDQKVGRLMRLYDKSPRLVDVVDILCPQLLRRYETRSRAYRAIGMPTPKPTEITL